MTDRAMKSRPITAELLTEVMQAHGKQAHEYHAQQVYLKRYHGHPTTHSGASWRMCTAFACLDATRLHRKVFREVGAVIRSDGPYSGLVPWQRALRKIQKKVREKLQQDLQ